MCTTAFAVTLIYVCLSFVPCVLECMFLFKQVDNSLYWVILLVCSIVQTVMCLVDGCSIVRRCLISDDSLYGWSSLQGFILMSPLIATNMISTWILDSNLITGSNTVGVVDYKDHYVGWVVHVMVCLPVLISIPRHFLPCYTTECECGEHMESQKCIPTHREGIEWIVISSCVIASFMLMVIEVILVATYHTDASRSVILLVCGGIQWAMGSVTAFTTRCYHDRNVCITMLIGLIAMIPSIVVTFVPSLVILRNGGNLEWYVHLACYNVFIIVFSFWNGGHVTTTAVYAGDSSVVNY